VQVSDVLGYRYAPTRSHCVVRFDLESQAAAREALWALPLSFYCLVLRE
jgi:hypothetical protein